MDVLRLSQVFIVLFGAIVVYTALKGFTRTGSSSMLFLGVGFIFVTVGALIDGLLFEFLGVDLVGGEALQAVSQAVGFFMIVYSLVRGKN